MKCPPVTSVWWIGEHGWVAEQPDQSPYRSVLPWRRARPASFTLRDQSLTLDIPPMVAPLSMIVRLVHERGELDDHRWWIGVCPSCNVGPIFSPAARRGLRAVVSIPGHTWWGHVETRLLSPPPATTPKRSLSTQNLSSSNPSVSQSSWTESKYNHRVNSSRFPGFCPPLTLHGSRGYCSALPCGS